MKIDIRNVVILVLVAVILVLLFPRLSFADEMAPSPAPAPGGAPGCLPNPFPITELCPEDHPHTGDITVDNQKYCCQ